MIESKLHMRRRMQTEKRQAGSRVAVVIPCEVAGLLACAGSASVACAFEGQITETEFSAPLEDVSAVAVDSGGHLWVTEPPVEGGIADKYSPTGSWEAHTVSSPWGKAHNSQASPSTRPTQRPSLGLKQRRSQGFDPAGASYAGPSCNPSAKRPGSRSTSPPTAPAAPVTDLYVFGDHHVIRIDGATGTPLDFTEASSAGTNELTTFPPATYQIFSMYCNRLWLGKREPTNNRRQHRT